MRRINLVAWNNGGGLSRDVDTLIHALPPGQFEVTINGEPADDAKVIPRRIAHRVRNLSYALSRRGERKTPPFDLNIFMEDISPEFFVLARVNAFIPNPEWFRAYMRFFLSGIDVVLCKTEHAQTVFSGLGAETRQIGFTSDDRMDGDYVGERRSDCLHIAGRSWQKGTQALLDVWMRHPEWPELTVVQNARTYSQSTVKPVSAPNINHILERLDDQALKTLQNTHAIHLCPSEVEGFGHCIVEAMSAAALTLTTDAPPMNELISTERGVLVAYNRSVAQRSGQVFFVDEDDLERKIQAVISMDDLQRSEFGDNARRWYLENDQLFRERLMDAIEHYCG